MRAGRLVNLLLLLERRGRLTAAELAGELEVSVRTVLRDIDALSSAGVPVYGVRGPQGGFELVDGYRSDLSSPEEWSPQPSTPGRPRRASVRITDDGRRLAAVMRILQPMRVRRSAPRDALGRHLATFRIGGLEMTARQVVSLASEIEVLEPRLLRTRVAELAAATAELYAAGAPDQLGGSQSM